MKEILLYEPMYSFFDKKKSLSYRLSSDFISGSPVVVREPIAIEYISGYLKSKGLSVEIIQQTTGNNEEVLNLIRKTNPKILGVSIHSSHIFPMVLNFLFKCKELFSDLIIVCSGNHPTCLPEIIEYDCIDYVIKGEGEIAFYEFATKIFSENDALDFKDISGLTYIDNGKIVHNKIGRRVSFNTLPWPVRKKMILKHIKCAPLAYPPPSKQKNAAQISFSRGCPSRCEFCVSPLVFPGKVIYREIKDVKNEIVYLQEKYETNFLFFTDLSFNANPKKISELCTSIVDNKVKINWFCYCNMCLEEDLIEKMVSAGCTRIGTGAESFSSIILEIYKSQQTLADVERCLRAIDKYGALNRVYLSQCILFLQ